MSYQIIKYVHVTCVALSGLGFLLRGVWMLRDSPWLKSRPAIILPHLLDSLLLGSALTLAVLSSQYPLVNTWLTAKFAGLLVYIVCGSMALKRGRTKVVRASFFVLALLAYAYIISVALTRHPLPWLWG